MFIQYLIFLLKIYHKTTDIIIIFFDIEVDMQPEQQQAQEISYVANQIEIKYYHKLWSIASKDQGQKILRIMCRVSPDGGTWITNGAWNYLGFASVFNAQTQAKDKAIRSWGTKTSLGLIYNNEPKILIQLSTVCFPNLIHLCLDQNNIQSIQAIANCQMPRLAVLNLNQNNIVSLRSLRRANFPQLLLISVISNPSSGNLINNVNLHELNSPDLQVLTQFKSNQNSKTSTLHLSGLINSLKLQTNKLITYHINTDGRWIKQHPIFSVFNKKYKQVKVDYYSLFSYKSLIDRKKVVPQVVQNEKKQQNKQKKQ